MKKVEQEIHNLKAEVAELLADKDIMAGEEKLEELQVRVDNCNEMVDEMASYEPTEIDAEALASDIVDLMLDLSALRLRDRRLAQTKWRLTHPVD